MVHNSVLSDLFFSFFFLFYVYRDFSHDSYEVTSV